MRKIYWDGYGFANEHSGVAVHASSLLRALNQLKCLPTVLTPYKLPLSYGDTVLLAPKRWGWVSPLWRSKVFWPQVVGNWLDHFVEPGVIVHGLSNFNLPLRRKRSAAWRGVLTVHDMIPFMTSHGVSSLLKAQMRYCMPRAMDLADAIICVSQWTKDCIGDLFPRYLAKTIVIPNGATTSCMLERRLGRKKPFGVEERPIRILTIARWEPYKNLELVLRLLSKSSQVSATIVTDSRGVKKMSGVAAELKGRLVLRKSCSPDELASLFLESDVYAHPSYFEGYCLPASEALAAGLPVVYLGGSGIDEVCGHGPSIRLERHSSDEDWIDAIKLAVQEQFIVASRPEDSLSKLPTWDDSARRLVSLYNSIE